MQNAESRTKFSAVKDPTYDNFKKWVINQGGIINNIDYPVKFADKQALSVVATQSIKPNTMVLAIPNSLIITSQKIRSTDLREIIEPNSQLFDCDNDFESEILVFVLFLMYEKNKTLKSFWYPYIQIIKPPFNITSYTVKEIERLEDPYLQRQAFEYFFFVSPLQLLSSHLLPYDYYYWMLEIFLLSCCSHALGAASRETNRIREDPCSA